MLAAAPQTAPASPHQTKVYDLHTRPQIETQYGFTLTSAEEVRTMCEAAAIGPKNLDSAMSVPRKPTGDLGSTCDALTMRAGQLGTARILSTDRSISSDDVLTLYDPQGHPIGHWVLDREDAHLLGPYFRNAQMHEFRPVPLKTFDVDIASNPPTFYIIGENIDYLLDKRWEVSFKPSGEPERPPAMLHFDTTHSDQAKRLYAFRSAAPLPAGTYTFTITVQNTNARVGYSYHIPRVVQFTIQPKR